MKKEVYYKKLDNLGVSYDTKATNEVLAKLLADAESKREAIGAELDELKVSYDRNATNEALRELLNQARAERGAPAAGEHSAVSTEIGRAHV